MARSIGVLGNGKIKCLSSSPTKENQISFYGHGRPMHAFMYLGTWLDITNDFLQSSEELSWEFADGFDVIVEDTSFQMYGDNRTEQIKFISKVLKKNGILILNEKLNGVDYEKREDQKDLSFKSRFFSLKSIENKKNIILKTMSQNQVSLKSLTDALSYSFRAAVCIWNSGNFYSIAASNNIQYLKEFTACLIPPCIPKEFSYHLIPFALFGLNNDEVTFRDYET